MKIYFSCNPQVEELFDKATSSLGKGQYIMQSVEVGENRLVLFCSFWCFKYLESAEASTGHFKGVNTSHRCHSEGA